MFQEEDLNEFINKIFDNAIESNGDVKKGLVMFKKYLDDASLCDYEYLLRVDKIIECSSEILELKKKLDGLDVMFLVENALNYQTKVKSRKRKKSPVKIVVDNSGSSDRCGCSSSSSSRCGGGSYTDRC